MLHIDRKEILGEEKNWELSFLVNEIEVTGKERKAWKM